MNDAHHFLGTLAVVLCTAAVTTVVFQRLKQPVVLGYLLAGTIVGPYVPVPIQADNTIVQTLSELGIILLMFSLGLEFSLRKLLRVGAPAGIITLMQASLMIWLGFLAGQALGWTRLESFYAGAAISISSTTIIVKAFEEQRIRGDFTELVFGVLIVEDLVAILLLAVLTAISSGESVTASGLAQTAGRLALFLLILFVVGLLTIPRLMRLVVRLNRPETTVVSSVGLAFGFAALAQWFGYSVALGAFIAGSLVAESGVEHRVIHLVQPVRDVFAAIFFVSVGMLIDPVLIANHWQAVLVFLAIVVIGDVVAVGAGAFLTGHSVQTSVKTGMSLAQIGEFSFIIAGVGIATGATRDFLYPIAVAVSAVTTLSTPWLIRAAPPVAQWFDRKLPRSLQTFVALYGSWLDQWRTGSDTDSSRKRLRHLIRWLLVDAFFIAAIIIGASINIGTLSGIIEEHLHWSERVSEVFVIGLAALVSIPFWVGLVRTARSVGWELANHSFPQAAQGRLDTADAPRRLMIVTLQMTIVLLLGVPLLAVTQPFLPPLQSIPIVAAVLVLLVASFWRRAANFQGHARAAAQVIATALSNQMREGRPESTHTALEEVNRMLVGLGSPIPTEIKPDSPSVGKTLAALNLRGLTGATILAIRRGDQTLLVPDGRETLQAGDVLALAGKKEAIDEAHVLLLGTDSPQLS